MQKGKHSGADAEERGGFCHTDLSEGGSQIAGWLW